MLVHQSSRSCNMCGNSKDSEIVDIPFEEIKLSPFAVKCECGYFYEAYHYAVSFHKWKIAKAVIENTLSDEFEITAKTEDGEIMAMEHKKYNLFGLQFHPESIYTPEGMKIIENFIKI